PPRPAVFSCPGLREGIVWPGSDQIEFLPSPWARCMAETASNTSSRFLRLCSSVLARGRRDFRFEIPTRQPSPGLHAVSGEAAERDGAAIGRMERLSHLRHELLVSLAHELRTPLQTMLAWTDFLFRRNMDDEVHHGIEAIERALREQARLIEE